MKTVNDPEFVIKDSYSDYTYQKELTDELDRIKDDFNYELLHKIVLWKLNRFPLVNEETLELLNQITKEQRTLNVELTKQILSRLLDSKGIQLAMASTILRFKNPYVYQIIDQRVYRLLNGEKMDKLTKLSKDEQIESYLTYLEDLQKACTRINIPFHISDRILYMADKDINKYIKLDSYG
ncbi:hypothetical protein QWY31_13170 [Cytophagales bacterium LB-30]|uniref:Uncharacterized protein n=1 Tax=Shiella aurantiaca TaxID=3058365 RepID=A0ABT8F7M3_9BACT|nr:hypothetical protein [Shiella aurantiaca]MDN4166455.1 hypothetical protein [Shiella aurantiaca]